ncbi:MAG: VOC family protein [Verrucomicrobia bacterium]|nr:VOC family protein [Verrucomicrobiota bacterium]MBI3870357.1 VOC family protein [Verrucomicrobiota bacterium]
MSAKPVPDGYDCLIPYLIVRGAAKALEFYKELFGATELLRMPDPSGAAIRHAELKIRDAVLMLADEMPACGFLSPQSVNGPPPSSLLLYLSDVDAVFAKAVSLGAKPLQPPTDQFYGDRMARFADPFGHIWSIATHVEDVPQEEMGRRAAEWMKKHG